MSKTEKIPSLPGWMLEAQRENAPLPPADGKKHAPMRFMRKTLRAVTEVFENELFAEKYAAKPLFLQSVDVRIRLLMVLAMLLFSAFCANPAVLVLLAGVTLLYAKLSGLPLRTFLRRAWLYLPPLVLLCSLPAASSLFVRGTPLITLPAAGVYFSFVGLTTAFRAALRTGISLSLGLLLLFTTRWSQITGAFASFRMPALLVSLLNMAYRYVFVLCTVAKNRVEARFLRTVGTNTFKEGRTFVGRSMGLLFIRSHEMSRQIFEAMVCRGYTGRPVFAEKTKLRAADWLFFSGGALVLGVLGMLAAVL